jgi:hypothetical protein
MPAAVDTQVVAGVADTQAAAVADMRAVAAATVRLAMAAAELILADRVILPDRATLRAQVM